MKLASRERTPVLCLKSASEKAHYSGRWGEIIFRALSARVAHRWKFVSFRGKGGGEARGVVDVLAVRKDMAEPAEAGLKRGDLFEIVLIQIKAGGARPPTADDCQRLRQVAKRYRATRIVLFEFRRRHSSRFFVLGPKGWTPTTGAELFGSGYGARRRRSPMG
jgi:hypothetical protein